MTTAPQNRKRRFDAFVRTLNDITNDVAYDDANGNFADGGGGKITIQHIPSLPDEKTAAGILRRIHSEFSTIIEKRGWNVTSITEMCCCGDGLRFSEEEEDKCHALLCPGLQTH